jgi:hypothetical protein
MSCRQFIGASVGPRVFRGSIASGPEALALVGTQARPLDGGLIVWFSAASTEEEEEEEKEEEEE